MVDDQPPRRPVIAGDRLHDRPAHTRLANKFMTHNVTDRVHMHPVRSFKQRFHPSAFRCYPGPRFVSHQLAGYDDDASTSRVPAAIRASSRTVTAPAEMSPA